MTRDEVKTNLFVVMFGESWQMEHSRMGDAFRQVYPAAWRKLLDLKRRKGHKWVAHELQKRESEVVIGDVCERMGHDPNQHGFQEALVGDYRHIPLLTVHDSILTTEEHVATVQGLLERAFSRRYIIPPRFQIKEPAR